MTSFRAFRHYHLDLLHAAWEELEGGSRKIAKETIGVAENRLLPFDGPFGKALVATVAGSEIVRLYDKYEDRLFDRIEYREQRGHPFIKGDLNSLEGSLADAEKKNLKSCSQIVIVQPGISRSAVAGKNQVLLLLASADDYLVRCGCQPLRVIGSE